MSYVQVTEERDSVEELVHKIDKRLDHIDAQIKRAAEVHRDANFSIRTGEDPLTSRTFSVGRLMKGLLNRDASKTAKVEMDLCGQLTGRYEQLGYITKANSLLNPLSSDLMPFESSFTKLVKDVTGVSGDPDEMVRIRKDLTTTGTTTGSARFTCG